MRFLIAAILFSLVMGSVSSAQAQKPAQVSGTPEKVIMDTDIGDDIDDAFAIALALKSPELEILGISTTFGDTGGQSQNRRPFARRSRALRISRLSLVLQRTPPT